MAVVPCRPLGVLIMRDERGPDDKIIAAPLAARAADLPAPIRDQIAHFFEHYKDLEAGKWVKLERWADAGEAARLIREALARAAAASADR